MKNNQSVLIRFFVYTLLLLLLGGFLNYVAGFGDIEQFKEGGILEWLQFAVLGVSAALMMAAAMRRKPGGKIFPVITAFAALLAMVRECDALLDQAIPVGGWQAPAAILVVSAILLAWYNRRIFGRELARFAATPVFALMWAGLIVVIYGQLTGHGPFLEPLLGDDYDRDYKRLLEECLEMLGYFFILVASLELFLEHGDPSDTN
ncbi:MAG: hypothetical protein R6U41_09050 [Desulfosalsimonas sp.]|uniref:hypothetical protein n=1 Tax=Desulfosalsimonas sp. TaxID=3073848 RepID=UPI003970BCA5